MSAFVEHSRGNGTIVAVFEDGTMYVSNDRTKIWKYMDDPIGYEHLDVETWEMDRLSDTVCRKAEAALQGMNGTEAEAFLVYVRREGFVPDMDAWNESTIWIDPEDDDLVSAWIMENVGTLSTDTEALLVDYLDAERLVQDFYFASCINEYAPSGVLYLYATELR